MRRIVVTATGMAGISCAVRVKQALPDCEINVIMSAPPEEAPSFAGPAGKRYAAELPSPDFLTAREISVLEAYDITPDLAAHEIALRSSRGKLSIRYTDLVIEAPAMVRLPRALQKADNVFPWPATALQAEQLDAALFSAREREQPVIVVGDGTPALEAVFLALEAGVLVHWIRTGEKDIPDIDPHHLALVLKQLGERVVLFHLPELSPEKLNYILSDNDGRLVSISLPDDSSLPVACCLWVFPLMARHPILREDGVVLDSFGRIEISEDARENLKLHVMGSGAAVPSALLAGGSLEAPVYPGGAENAAISASATVSALLGQHGPLQGAFGASSARTDSIQLYRAGFSITEAEQRGLQVVQATLAAPLDEDAPESGQLVLSLVCHLQKRTLIGVHVLSLSEQKAPAEGLFGMVLAAMNNNTPLDILLQRGWAGLPARLLGDTAAILRIKLDTPVQGITPDELLASRHAGAEFFTLDLRLYSEWNEGHLPDAYNIPLTQLKKRLQDEVPRFTPLVLVCADGRTAGATACRLAALGASDLYILDGGMDLWPYPLK